MCHYVVLPQWQDIKWRWCFGSWDLPCGTACCLGLFLESVRIVIIIGIVTKVWKVLIWTQTNLINFCSCKAPSHWNSCVCQWTLLPLLYLFTPMNLFYPRDEGKSRMRVLQSALASPAVLVYLSLYLHRALILGFTLFFKELALKIN